jgi:sulfur dioxygenase
MQPIQLFDPESCTYTYLLFDQASREALIIDPVDTQLERDLATLREYGLKLLWTVETHAHADHITSAGLLAEHTGARTVAPAGCGIGNAAVQLQDGDTLAFGSQKLQAIATPGHTAGSMSYYWESAGHRHVFTGDTLLINGCGRTDFQSGSAAALWHSITARLFALPADTTVWPGHDYHGRKHSSIGHEQAHNPRLAGKTEQEFIAIMDGLNLPRPRRMDEAVPANLNSGLRHDLDGALLLQPRPAQGYAGDVSPHLAWQWVQAGEAVLVDVRTDAEREWVGFVPDAVGTGLEAVARHGDEPGLRRPACSRPPAARSWCCCAAAACVRSRRPGAPPSWAWRPTTSWKASRAIRTPTASAVAWAAGVSTACLGARADIRLSNKGKP